MSVINGDVTGENFSDFAPMPPAENATKLDHLLVDIGTGSPTDTDGTSLADMATDYAAFHQATIALSVSDVIDLGTESVAGIDALVIHGEQGDTVHLANQAGYLWSRAEEALAPDGYHIYQANALADHAPVDIASAHGEPVYVLVQHDLTVILETA
jgi:hypothetical protein